MVTNEPSGDEPGGDRHGGSPRAAGTAGGSEPDDVRYTEPVTRPTWPDPPEPPAGVGPGQWRPPGPPPPAPPYGPPGWGPGQPIWVPRPTNGMAIAAMILGILWIYWIGSILALVFGYIARNQIRERGEGGDGMAVAGIVLGWIGIGVLALILVFGFTGALASIWH